MTIPIVNPFAVAPGRFAARLSSGVFINPVAGMRLPDRDQLVGEYILGVDATASVKNRANPALPLTVQGGPTYNAASVTVRPHATAGFGFLTNIIPDENYTLICVRKNPTQSGTTYFVVGMDRAAGSPQHGFRAFGADNYGSTGETTSNGGAKRTRPASTTEVYFEAVVQSIRNPQWLTGGFGTFYWYTSGGVQQNIVSDVVINANRAPWKQIAIGSNLLIDTITTNNIEVFFVAIYNKPLTAAQIDAAHSAIVAYYATRGVTVV